jgi:hypothetical protein
MPKKITFGLSPAEINNAIQEIRKYQSDIAYKCQKLAQRLAEEGVYIARLKIAEYDAIYTGELLESIKSEYGGVVQNGGKWIIYTGCDWAPFVEFGTGVVGSENPHPDASLVNWKYDINEHGEAGWSYQKDGQWHWTKGMPSRPFMYETGRDLRLIVQKIAKEVFNS